MALPFRSLDDMLAQDAANGSMTRCIAFDSESATTAATAASGLLTLRRLSRAFTAPAFAGNAYMTYFRAGVTASATLSHVFAAIEVNLGSISLSTGTFTDASVMPTRTIAGGTSAQLTTGWPVMYVSAAATATTPTITTTYKNQAGTGSKSCALTLPTSPAVNSAFMMSPHLASGDTGIQDVTNITKSAGTVGTLSVVGLLPIGFSGFGGSNGPMSLDILSLAAPMYPINAGDVISFWQTSISTTAVPTVMFQLQLET